jgi:CRP/FNR family transcriptional regulator
MRRAADVIDIRDSRFSCEICGMRTDCLGCGLDATGVGRQRVLRAGDHLFRTTDPLKSVYTIRSGWVKTYVISEGGEEQILGFHGPGDVVGFDAIADGHHACSAVALETSSICKLSFDALTRLCHDSSSLVDRLVRTMSRGTQHLVDNLLLGRKSAEVRVAAFVLKLASQQQRRGYSANVLALPMSRTDIGKYLGLTVETVSRVLSRLEGLGLISKKRNQLELHDVAGLQRVAASPAEDEATDGTECRA